MRTETTINNPMDFYLGKAVDNLAHLRDLVQQVNRKLLEVERISHHCVLIQEALDCLQLRPSRLVNASQPCGSATRGSSRSSKPSVRLRICRAAFFYAKLHLRIFRPNWAALLPDPDGLPRSLCAVLDQLDVEIQKLHEEAAIAA